MKWQADIEKFTFNVCGLAAFAVVVKFFFWS